jgi:hypothetical protein
VVEGLGTD